MSIKNKLRLLREFRGASHNLASNLGKGSSNSIYSGSPTRRNISRGMKVRSRKLSGRKRG